MKLVSFVRNGIASWGVLREARIYDTGAVLNTQAPDLKTALEQGLLSTIESNLAAAPQVNVKDVTWQPVIPNPGKIFCVGLNYQSHTLINTVRDEGQAH